MHPRSQYCRIGARVILSLQYCMGGMRQPCWWILLAQASIWRHNSFKFHVPPESTLTPLQSVPCSIMQYMKSLASILQMVQKVFIWLLHMSQGKEQGQHWVLLVPKVGNFALMSFKDAMFWNMHKVALPSASYITKVDTRSGLLELYLKGNFAIK